METNYEKQAQDFLQKTNTTFVTEFLKNDKYFDSDKETRDIYMITLQRGARIYKFKFGNSLAHSGFKLKTGAKKEIKLNIPDDKRQIYLKDRYSLYGFIRQNIAFNLIPSDEIIFPVKPNAYDVLACLNKYEVGAFTDFCNEFGYDTDSISATKIYDAVCDEWKNVQILWTNEEIEQLQEIQ